MIHSENYGNLLSLTLFWTKNSWKQRFYWKSWFHEKKLNFVLFDIVWHFDFTKPISRNIWLVEELWNNFRRMKIIETAKKYTYTLQLSEHEDFDHSHFGLCHNLWGHPLVRIKRKSNMVPNLLPNQTTTKSSNQDWTQN